MILVDTTTLNRTSSGSVTGKISLQLNDVFFPEKDWNDFVVVVLNWWVRDLKPFMSGLSNKVTLSFMDGPFKIRFLDDGDVTNVILFNGEKQIRNLMMDTNSLKNSIHENLVEVIKSIVEACKKRNWSSDDIQELTKNLKSLN